MSILSASARGWGGDYREKETPVPIPNTEVKLLISDDTAWATAWENRKLPLHPLAEAEFFIPAQAGF